MANSVDPDQSAPIGAVCSRSTLFASILMLSVMLGNYLQQMTLADDIFRYIFSWRFKGICLNSLPSGEFFLLFCHLLIPFSKFNSSKNSLGIPSECLTDWIQVRFDVLKN